MLAIPAPRKQRGRWIAEYEDSLVYRVISRAARATPRNPLENQKRRGKILSLNSLFASNHSRRPCIRRVTESLN